MRRLFDAVCAALGLLLLSPLLAVLALLIKLEDGGPVWYVQRRIGRGMVPFGLRKFRTMVTGADRMGARLTTAGDPRITRTGAFLRRFKLDELPQLYNVLRGDMALVGARPELPRYVEMFRAQYEEILRQRPGITDPASLAFRNESDLLAGHDWETVYVNQILPRKLELSLRYLRRRTLLSDVVMILRTVFGLASHDQPGAAALGGPREATPPAVTGHK